MRGLLKIAFIFSSTIQVNRIDCAAVYTVFSGITIVLVLTRLPRKLHFTITEKSRNRPNRTRASNINSELGESA